ncbi:MAG: endonuclease/exonuclease/phosphatase family protein [Prochloraceae cyanobacterium]|nr:endonuclease/exonuclease/phosphatase family protein [Prochloraceae cyanobacterium]
MVNISQIQGASLTSPRVNELVTTIGIVTAFNSNGFYLQDPIGDGNIATSEGIFVFTDSAPTVSVGDRVEVNGRVTEFTPSSRSNDLPVTEITSPTITVISSGNPLPAPVIIGSSGRIPPDRIFDSDNFTPFNPNRDGIDFFESIEGMRVTIQNPIAVSRTNRFDEIYTLANGGANATGVKNNPGDRFGIIISPNDFNPERIQIQLDSDVLPNFTSGSLPVDVQNRFASVTGVVDYSFGNYEVIATEIPTLTPNSQSLPRETTNLVASADQLTVASYNVENLDPNDNDGDRDIAEGKFDSIAAQIVNNLGSPDIIALQEIQDNSGSADNGVVNANQTYQTLINRITAAGGPTYQFTDLAPANNQDGGQPGGNIRVGYLYNPNRVTLVPNSVSRIGVGNVDFNDSRKSLVAKFTFNGEEITLVNNHFASKGGSSPLFGLAQPPINGNVQQREGQAREVNNFVDGILATDPNAKVVVLGDLNEFEFFTPLTVLKGGNAPVLTNLTETLPKNQRYTYNFQGNAQALDHILVSNNLTTATEYDVVHINSEYSQQASDHDPMVARLRVPRKFTLQILHAADQEAGIPALDDAPRFSAVLNALKNQDANNDGNPDYPNTVLLSSGDAYIPGLFLDASGDPSLAPLLGKEGRGRGDIIIQNELGFQAIAFGNHEFDLGTELVRSVIAPDAAYPGANFPYLSANLDFSTDTNLANLVTPDGQEASTIPNKIAGNTIVTVNGEKIQ